MGFFDDLFGDQGEGASQQQAQQNIGDRTFANQIFSGARADALPLFDIGQQQKALSSQQALDVFGGSIPAQLQAFQQGNVGAQQALLGGQFTPQAINVDTSFIPQLLAQISPEQQQQIKQQGALQSMTQDIDRQISAAQTELDRAVQAGGKRNRKAAAAQRAQLVALNNQRQRILEGQV